ncbi:MAG: hypothetical protein ACOY5C_02680 [Pseudomonadota bacterium]|uniref:hypothetical protein n=1 Tax=Thermithiobacillus tepidarius TaxID=929 RepID=UPI0004177403|nr:hypothetical protein [Thermithiobacillus tepidarius]
MNAHISNAKLYDAEILIDESHPLPLFVGCSFYNCRITVRPGQSAACFRDCLFHGCSYDGLERVADNCLFDDQYALAV